MTAILDQISDAIIEGKVSAMGGLTKSALDQGLKAQEILNNALLPGMNFVGAEFKAGSMFVPEVLRSAQAMKGAMVVLQPLLAASGTDRMGKLLLGTCKGDLHDIGKNLVGMMCEGAGFEVKDLGIDVGPQGFVKAITEFQPDVVGISALLTTTMRAMGDTVTAIKEAGLRDKVKVIIGGAPVSQGFADEIGADGYASNAASAAELAQKLIGR